jgi:myo-inositol-1(or 4)-monophosphatase
VPRYALAVDEDLLLRLLEDTAAAVSAALERHSAAPREDLREPGDRPGQYRLDLVADAAALPVLRRAGVGILSEESGLHDPGSGVIVVIDPVDGSTNASRGIPWFATSLCAVDEHGPSVALVANLATGTRYRAVRGRGATCDGRSIRPSPVRRVADALIVLNGHARGHFGWRQYRSLGASALDLCSVADGRVDGTVDCTDDALGPWDYLGAMLVIAEAGGHLADEQGRDLVVLDHAARRTPVSAGTSELHTELLQARREMPAW